MREEGTLVLPQRRHHRRHSRHLGLNAVHPAPVKRISHACGRLNAWWLKG